MDGLPNLKKQVLDFCEPCVQGKLTVDKPKSKRPLELIHSDVCGPVKPETIEGFKYFTTFIDDYTHFVVVYLMKNKSEVFSCFQKYNRSGSTISK